jgi:hypothetical protein
MTIDRQYAPIVPMFFSGAKIATRLLENFPNRGKAPLSAQDARAQKPIRLFFDADFNASVGDAQSNRANCPRRGRYRIWFARDFATESAASTLAARSTRSRFHLLVRVATGLPFLGHAMRFKRFASTFCRPSGSRVHRWIRRRRRAVISRSAPVAHPRNSVRWNHAEGSKVRFFQDSLRMLRKCCSKN